MELKKALRQQQNEINDHTLYTILAREAKNPKNRRVLEKIAHEEKLHYEFWKKITVQEVIASKPVVSFYTILVMLLGVSFALKLLESRESESIIFYQELSKTYPEAEVIYQQEQYHEIVLIDMLQDTKLHYAGAIVLGMNDALVELTGTLSGIALAFDRSIVVGITGVIMGIAASLSMAGSAYLESKENPDTNVTPFIYALYTGGAYILTTLILIAPFFIIDSVMMGLVLMFGCAFLSIVLYNFYIAVAKNQSFIKRTMQMGAITFGVALVSFSIGYVVKHFFGITL